MLPTTPRHTERVLDRATARKRPSHPTPLQPRDKRPHYEVRFLRPEYPGGMSQPHDNLKEREAEMKAWLEGVAREKRRVYGWTTDETVEHSSIDRATWYRWKKISQYGNMPTAKKLIEFCQSLGVDPADPFQIIGYTRPDGQPEPAPEPAPLSEIDSRINLLRVAIDRPGIKADERQELEVQLTRLIATKRMNLDSLAAADEALKRHGAA